MKLPRLYSGNHGLTLMETVVVAFLLVIVAAVLLPALRSPRPHVSRINCMNNLKQVTLAFRVWAQDNNNDKYPMAVSFTNGGAMEAIQGGNPMMVFQVMSNELSTPRILVCPDDEDHQYATNFDPSLSTHNVSYFVNPDVSDENPRDILTGDDNLQLNGTPFQSGITVVSTNSSLAWLNTRHKLHGTFGIADGSVYEMDNRDLANRLHSTNFTHAPRYSRKRVIFFIFAGDDVKRL